jgi:hypothetical protein
VVTLGGWVAQAQGLVGFTPGLDLHAPFYSFSPLSIREESWAKASLFTLKAKIIFFFFWVLHYNFFSTPHRGETLGKSHQILCNTFY